jgi:hypothetical protein
MSRVSYEPELSPFLYAYFGENKFILSKSGNVQISGAKNPADMLIAYNFGKKFVQDLNVDGQITVTGKFDEGVKARPKARAKATLSSQRGSTRRKPSTPQVCARMKKSERHQIREAYGCRKFQNDN